LHHCFSLPILPQKTSRKTMYRLQHIKPEYLLD
jgi:hypothetical protein